MMKSNSFGEIVKRERLKQGMSLKKLSEAVMPFNNGEQINPSYIFRIENKEQINPSFTIVAILSSVLNLDMREVFRAYGFEQLIMERDSSSNYDFNDLMRLHNISIMDENRSIRRNLSNKEKEAILSLMEAVFQYTSDVGNKTDDLITVLKTAEYLKTVQKNEANIRNAFEVSYYSSTYTVHLDSVLHIGEKEFEAVRKSISEFIKQNYNTLLDLSQGIIELEVGGEEWLARKENYDLFLLTKKSKIHKV
ncbi:helix-turn-helix domain-containing protein [Jeotgalibacillus sp. JSM ZJ347]|uniref:helix-turn-helix domain-containing protein n=1 Tax=Jeotgalibacillus sp. JSM ZJ347 TaxID=3342117 RepID=UPI0035A890E7